MCRRQRRCPGFGKLIDSIQEPPRVAATTGEGSEQADGSPSPGVQEPARRLAMTRYYDISTGEQIAEPGLPEEVVEPTDAEALAMRMVTVAEAVAEHRRQQQPAAAVLMVPVDELLARYR